MPTGSCSSSHTYREQESVLEVGEVSVAFLAAVLPVVLVNNLLVAVARRTGHVQTRLPANVDHRRHAAEVVGLRFQRRGRVTMLWLNPICTSSLNNSVN